MSEVAVSSQLVVSEGIIAARTLDRSLVHGLVWTAGGKWATQALSWASWLIVARLLTPEDYGLVGMAGIYLGLITLLSEFGLGVAVLTFRDLSLEQLAQLNGLALLLGLGCLLASCALAIPLGHFFRATQLPLVVVVMSTTFVIASFKTVPLALLQRDLRFKTIALIDAGQALVLATSMVGFALAGFRYWTLVLGGVLGALISTGAMLKLRHAPLAWPRIESLKRTMTLSSDVLISRLCWYAYSNADFLVAGRILGKTALGFYNCAWTLANLPVEKVTTLVGQVTPAIFSAVQTQHSAIRRYVLGITEGISLMIFPVSLGLVLVAKDFVFVVLGSKWEGATVPLQLLAAYAGFRSITPLLAQVLLAIKDSKFVMWNSVTSAIVMPISFYFAGSRWGTIGLGVVWIMVYPLIASMFFWRVFRKIELPLRAYMGALWPALSGTILMAAVVLAVRASGGRDWSRGFRLAAEVASAVIVYVLTCLLVHRQRLRRFWELVMTAPLRSDPASMDRG